MNLEQLEEHMNNRSFFQKHIRYLPVRTWRRIGDFFRSIKHAFQRVYRGYDDTAYWDLQYYIAEIALPVLKDYRKDDYKGIPCDLSEEEYNEKLDMMIEAFHLIIKDDCTAEHWERDHEKIQKGLKEFAKYYQSLWS